MQGGARFGPPSARFDSPSASYVAPTAQQAPTPMEQPQQPESPLAQALAPFRATIAQPWAAGQGAAQAMPSNINGDLPGLSQGGRRIGPYVGSDLVSRLGIG